MVSLEQIVGFDWDDGNGRKSADKHDVSQADAESIFFGDPLIVAEDSKHSKEERRFHALGRTIQGRTLHVTFTLRENETLIRVISARDMNRRERQLYGQA
ncbi:MAG: BrnT family toxin [Bradyrhizobium sp.]